MHRVLFLTPSKFKGQLLQFVLSETLWECLHISSPQVFAETLSKHPTAFLIIDDSLKHDSENHEKWDHILSSIPHKQKLFLNSLPHKTGQNQNHARLLTKPFSANELGQILTDYFGAIS